MHFLPKVLTVYIKSAPPPPNPGRALFVYFFLLQHQEEERKKQKTDGKFLFSRKTAAYVPVHCKHLKSGVLRTMRVKKRPHLLVFIIAEIAAGGQRHDRSHSTERRKQFIISAEPRHLVVNCRLEREGYVESHVME